MKKIFSVNNKVIVITGATGYLGSKMVEHLSLAGAKVIVLSTSLSKSKQLCKKLNLPENQAFEVDVSSKESIETVFEDIYDEFSAIDVLVNNAYFGVAKEFSYYTQEDWHISLDGTIVSIDMTTQAVIPYMGKSHAGRIINISSMYGMVSPNPDVYPNEVMINPLSYGVGKAGIIQYTKYAAMMLAKENITVNTISYGPFPNINNINNEAFLENLANKTFVKRIGKPEEVTSAIHFLSYEYYYELLAQIKEMLIDKVIYYIPHRGEDGDKLAYIEKNIGIKIKTINYPVELIYQEGILPTTIISFVSTALISLSKIYSNMDVYAIRLDYNELRKRKEAIVHLYKELENYVNIVELT